MMVAIMGISTFLLKGNGALAGVIASGVVSFTVLGAASSVVSGCSALSQNTASGAIVDLPSSAINVTAESTHSKATATWRPHKGQDVSVSVARQEASSAPLTIQWEHRNEAKLKAIQVSLQRSRSMFGRVNDEQWRFCGRVLQPSYLTPGSSALWPRGTTLAKLRFDLSKFDADALSQCATELELVVRARPFDRPVTASLSNISIELMY